MITVTTKTGNQIVLAQTDGHYTVDAQFLSLGIIVESVKLVDGAIVGGARVNGKFTNITAPLTDSSVAEAEGFFAKVNDAGNAAYRNSYDGHYDHVITQMTR